MIENRFVVISPVYNTAPYIEKCIRSVLDQDYKNFELMVIEDYSNDGTREIIKKLHESVGGFNVHYNDSRLESPIGNFVKGVQLSQGDKNDILVTVDGDDWLYSNDVLSYLNEVYQDPEVWLTYGQFVSATGSIKNTSKLLRDTRNYRSNGTWVTSHLRTLKRGLFNKINDRDLRDKRNNYYVYYPDPAYMFPAIEMAGLKHIKFIDKVLYVYNDLSPLCSAHDWKNKNMDHVYAVSAEIRAKPVYDEIKEF